MKKVNFPAISFIIILISISCISNLFAQWEKVNGPSGARSNRIYINSENTIFRNIAGEDIIYKSDDSGISWVKCSEQQIHLIYIDSDDNLYGIINDDGLFLSRNNGDTWSKILDTGGEVIQGITVIENKIFVSGTIFKRSFDNGLTWQDIEYVFDNSTYTTMSSLFACNDSTILAGTFGGGNIYRTTDAGNSWNKVYDTNVERVWEMSRADNGDIYAALRGTLLSSSDNGKTWQDLLLDRLPQLRLIHEYFSILPFNNIFFAATHDGVFKFIPQGDSLYWENTTKFFNGRNRGFFDLVKSTDGNIYCAADFLGIIGTTDRGTNWSRLNNGFNYESILYYFQDNLGNDFAYSPAGLYKRDNNGNEWKLVEYKSHQTTTGKFFDSYDPQMFFNSQNELILTYKGKELSYKSTDYGDSWDLVLGPYNELTVVINSINSQGDLFIIDSSKIFTKKYNHDTWELYTDTGSLINTIAVNSNDNLFISMNNGLYRKLSETSGLEPLGLSEIFKIIIDDNDNVYCIDSSGNVKVSYDYGDSWNLLQFDKQVVSLVTDSIERIFALTKSGRIFYSGITSSSWSEIPSNFQPDLINSINLDNSGDLYISYGDVYGTYTEPVSGLYKQTFDHSDNIISFDKPIGFSLYQNYPNPFNSSTTISYKINHKSRVSLKIYDVTGKLVRTILDTERNRGVYAESINLDKLSSGIYFYRLNYNGDSITKKLVLLK